MTLAQFRVRYPDFRSAPDGLVQATLDEAALEVDATVFGALWSAAHGAMTAHVLALSPFGKNARLSPEEGKVTVFSKYLMQLTLMARQGPQTI